MPRYFLNLYQNGDVLIDPEGIDLPNPQILRDRALHIVRDLISTDAASGVVDLDTALRIVDETDTLVLLLTVADAVSFVSNGVAQRSLFGLS
jgi:hypothetical protein